ncbi:hypothetical protein [Winogradskyella sediminis]|uniref:Outer membrane protein beta-barrel domain-containing protein n=1 Tax=Winogradskyella sediminis TaxID=1382466 RepID=A0A1H1U1C5_9FLAO|nr:hypothetical protein [Winogradskyella sediminis]SDS66193.1 hypothetical protein SAMN04489797_2102 [Winogradskyella sediminis]
MNTITKLVVYFMVSLALVTVQAQTKELDSIKYEKVNYKISLLEKDKNKVEEEERGILKLKISKINKQLDDKEITAEEAENLKKEAAKKAALNIENRIEIINKQIALLERNGYEAYQYKQTETGDDDGFVFRIGGSDDDTNESFIYFGEKSSDKPRKYDRRTTTDIVFAFGFNNTLIDGQDLEDSPYKLGGSGFIELGYAWKTRIFENTNFWRLKYGFSFQWNKLKLKDNNYLVNTDGDISLEEYRLDADKIKFRTTNLVIPMHLEFGPSKKVDREDYFRYSTYKQLKIGIGGYAGLNIGSMQKIKYKEDGEREKEKQRDQFEVSEFVYGLSGYFALGDVALYVKYDLNPLFKNQVVDQNNISVGLRFDMD